MEKVLYRYSITGVCKIKIKRVVAQWSEKCFISQYDESYTLCESDKSADNFSKTSFKVSISKEQAHILIGKLNLFYTPSVLFKNAGTWKTI